MDTLFHAPLGWSYTAALCRTTAPRYITRTYGRVECEDCSYILDVRQRLADLTLSRAYTRAALTTGDVHEAEWFARSAAHFAARALEVTA